MCLLEYGKGLKTYLQQHKHLIRRGNNGAVVINANPFTLGHQYLVEQAAARVDHLYVFVVCEDCSVFPFDVRFELVKAGTAHLDNVTVLETSDYAISSVTFPAYFLKKDDNIPCLQMEIDLLLFARKIAPSFSVKTRFIGSEPFCDTTRRYAETMHRVLAQEGVETVQLERKDSGGEAISASRVRRYLKDENYDALAELLPETTLEFIKSDKAEEIRQRLKHYQRRH
jgi:[citrate (pro-3S)-lyase] ligase